MDRPSWIRHAWILKNEGLFRISLMDRPQGLDRPSWIRHAWSLENKGLFRIALVDRHQGLDSWTLPLRPSLVDWPRMEP